MSNTVRRFLLGLVFLGLTTLAFAQEKDKDKPKDKPPEPTKDKPSDKPTDKPKDKPADPVKGKNAELIVGTWATEIALEDMKRLKVQVKFNADGTVVLTAEGKMTKGKYKFTDDETVEVEHGEGETASRETMKVKVTGKKMTMTSSKGKAQEFERVE